MTKPFTGWGIRVRWPNQNEPRVIRDVFHTRKEAIADWDFTFGDGDYTRKRMQGYIKAVKVKIVEVTK